MSRAHFQVPGLDCQVEAAALTAALEGFPGVERLGFDLINGVMTVDFDPGLTSPAAITARVAARAGMQAVTSDELARKPMPSQNHASFANSWRVLIRRWSPTVLSGLALLAAVILSTSPARASMSWGCYLLAIAAGAFDLFPKAARGLRTLSLDIHVLMGLAVVGAMILRQWDEAATVVFLFGLSESLEGLSLDRARRAIRSLLEVTPRTAELIGADGTARMVPAETIQKGDRVRVRAGDQIPVDGVVVTGRSSVDQKAITGESVPLTREAGDPVYAGTVNGDGTLELEASGPLGDAVISRVVARVREAQQGKAPIERRLTRFAAWYTPLVVVAALLVMVFPPLVHVLTGDPSEWLDWFSRGLVILVISCPCALVIATPVAVVSALTSAARHGVLVKGGQFLEEIGRLKVLAFDKTGTLTRGEPDVVEVVSEEGQEDEEVLRIAAALGDRGGHVLGRAIARHARELRLNVPQADNYTAFPGLGAQGKVGSEQYHLGSHRYLDEAGLCLPGFHARLDEAEGRVGTSVAVSALSGPMGWIRLADQARPEAAQVVSELGRLGIKTVMLTGDNTRTAAAMAAQLGVRDHRAGLLPSDKVNAVAELDALHGPTGMVGDGVNDAPALASARVSVALGGVSSGAAIESADIVLMADDLKALPWIVRHSRKTLRRIQENIVLALVTKGVVLLLAVLGFANLWLAIGADVGASLVVTLNALRLLRA